MLILICGCDVESERHTLIRQLITGCSVVVYALPRLGWG